LARLLPSLALTLVASLYNTMIPVTAGGPSASQTDNRLTVLHTANRAETASVIMPVGDAACRLKFYYRNHFISDFITR